MTSYEFERALVYIAEQIIKTFGEDVGVQWQKQEPAKPEHKPDLIDALNDDAMMQRVMKKSAEMQAETIKKAEAIK